jgi:RNA polymerase sigma factor (sigma-70 family)
MLAEIERLYEAKLDDFVRSATAICGDRERGRDAVHDAFVGVVRSRASFRGESAVEAWVWRAVVNAALKTRAQRRETPVAAIDAGAAPSSNGRLDSGAVRAAVALLPERQRLALFLRYYADLDYAQIADVLEVRRGTISASLHAAHETLRQRLQEISHD